MTELKLRLHIEGNPERTVKVAQNEFLIGRLPECDLCLPFSEVSRYHLRLTKTDTEGWLLEDLGSTNGTILNQFQLTSPQLLHHGDVIQVGNVFVSIILGSPFISQSTLIGSSREGQEGKKILRKAEELQKQWIDADRVGDPLTTHQTAIERLKYLVEIAKGLNSAQSIEAIFDQVKKLVFQEVRNIERLALLIDVDSSGKLQLINAASKNSPSGSSLLEDDHWISRTICKEVFTKKVSIKSVDAQSDERFEGENSILTKGIRGALAVPLWDKDQVVGVLYADARLRLTGD
ncbi:MAG: FHA domain-containing protein, partial [Moorea sp. SIO2B7]|nr:FHA domain-containing protein [Moorena sp. SIO2B7]